MMSAEAAEVTSREKANEWFMYHIRKKMKSLGRQGVDYHAKIGYRLKKET